MSEASSPQATSATRNLGRPCFLVLRVPRSWCSRFGAVIRFLEQREGPEAPVRHGGALWFTQLEMQANHRALPRGSGSRCRGRKTLGQACRDHPAVPRRPPSLVFPRSRYRQYATPVKGAISCSLVRHSNILVPDSSSRSSPEATTLRSFLVLRALMTNGRTGDEEPEQLPRPLVPRRSR